MKIVLLVVVLLMLDLFAIIEIRRSRIDRSLKSLVTWVVLLLPVVGLLVYYVTKAFVKGK
jgi:hypothetical protein